MVQFLIRVFALLLATASIGMAQNSSASSAMGKRAEGHFATAPAIKIAPVPARVLNAGPAAKVFLDPVGAERLSQEMATTQPQPGTPLKIGFSRDLPALRTFAQLADLATVTPATAAQIASISITSADALGIRLGLLIEKMPASAKFRFYAKDTDQAYEVSGREINDTIARNIASGDRSDEARTYWSPIIDGHEVVVEFELPNGIPVTEVVFSIPRLSHLYSSPLATKALQERIGQSGSCNLDSVCQSSWSNESLATAKMAFTSGGGSFICTGTLLSDSDASTSIPYFLSANHCISAQTEASSLQTFWFYRSNSCNSATQYSGTQTLTGGATLLYNTSVTDTSFMRLVGTPPAGTYFAGWTSTQQALGTGITGIHNPSGDLQKISFGSITNYLTCSAGSSYSCNSAAVGNANHLQVVWSQGITEGGSSGSGIWVTSGASHYLVGQLHGGQSYCSAPTAPDNYGRFDVAYNAALYQWLGATSSCSYSLSSSSVAAAAGGLSGTVGVTTTTGCAWSASSNAAWITITGGSSGTGNGTVVYAVASNTTATSRTGTLTIAGQTFTVTQAGSTGGVTTWQITVTKSGNGTGTVTSNPAGIDCGATCSASFTSGASVTLTATPATASTFTGWSGDCTGTGSCTVSMSASKSVTATFTSTAPSRYTDNGDGTVSDPGTGLTWMRCSMGQTWTGSTCTGTVSTYTFAQANALTATVTFAGQSDWRMPNIRELLTLVDRSASSPATDRTAFPNTLGLEFWSASEYAFSSSGVWVVNFSYGNVGYGHKGEAHQVRLVRAGQPFGSLLGNTRPTSDYVDHGNGTVTHTATALMWKRCSEGQAWSGRTCTGGAGSAYTFDQANALTGTSTFAGQSDWRLPTEDELLSLVDYSTYFPAINTSIFPATPNSYFWSASALAGNSSGAWVVFFYYGYASSYYKSNAYQVRLVRSGQSFGSFVLNVGKSGTGTGTVTSSPAGISCGTTCSASFTSGASVTLTATPATASAFTGWSGACTGTGSCTVSMSVARSVTATFSAGTAPSRYTDNGDGTVTDPGTGLTWMRCSMGQTWTGSTCTTGRANLYTFVQANALTATVTFAGQNDWRLPNIRELQTLLDRSVYSPSIDHTAFPNTQSWNFWSSTGWPVTAVIAWYFDFDGNGRALTDFPNGGGAVRLVRGGQPFGSLLGITRPTGDYVDHGNGTVTHPATALMWKRCAEGQAWSGSTCTGALSAYTFDQANALTGTSTFTGQGDWRLPTESELLSLVDYGNFSPSINTSIFPGTPSSEFWSSSPDDRNSGYAWDVNFSEGYADFRGRNGSYAVRLVRTGQSFSGATSGNDTLTNGTGNNTVDGLAGLDTYVSTGAGSNYYLSQASGIWTLTDTYGSEGTDTLTNIERLRFSDGVHALDIGAGQIGGTAYRIYKAAFNRTPDNGGLKYWMARMDTGTSLTDVAWGFIASTEFELRYGRNPTDGNFVTLLYLNVLGRGPDSGGYAYWINRLASGSSRQEVLIGFSESAENMAAVAPSIANGIWMTN